MIKSNQELADRLTKSAQVFVQLESAGLPPPTTIDIHHGCEVVAFWHRHDGELQQWPIEMIIRDDIDIAGGSHLQGEICPIDETAEVLKKRGLI